MSSLNPGDEKVLVKRSRLDDLEQKEWSLFHIRQAVETHPGTRSAVGNTPARTRYGLFGTSPPLVRFVSGKAVLNPKVTTLTEGDVPEAVVHEVPKGEALPGAALTKGTLAEGWRETKIERVQRQKRQREAEAVEERLPHWDAWEGLQWME